MIRDFGHYGVGIVPALSITSNSLGPVSDMGFFSEPSKLEFGYVIWGE
ncbi:MAG: hypothetical protein N2C12_15555 [Planctomycetales bacterium]